MPTIKVNISDLNDRQQEIFDDIIASKGVTKYFVIRAGRQSGKSYFISRLAIYFCLKYPGSINAFILGFHRQNRKIFADMLTIIPKEIVTKVLNGDGERSIEFINGSVLQFLTSSNYESIRGCTFDNVVCDEVSQWRIGSLAIIKPVVAAKRDAVFVMSSTPRGKNEFYEEALKGMDPDNDFVKHYRMTYKDNSAFDEREIIEQKKTLPETVFLQEYEGEFVFGKSSVFGLFSAYQILNQWGLPNGKQTYFGLDNSGDGEDKTVISIMDELGNTVYIEELEDMSMPQQVAYLTTIIKKWNAVGYSEYNGLGLGTSEFLQDNCPGKVEKWWTSNESKQELVTNFLYELNIGNIKLPTLELCPKLDNEMSTYSVTRLQSGKLQYSHPKGLHDDYVDSLMLANQARMKLNGSMNGEIWDDSIENDYTNETHIPFYLRNQINDY